METFSKQKNVREPVDCGQKDVCGEHRTRLMAWARRFQMAAEKSRCELQLEEAELDTKAEAATCFTLRQTTAVSGDAGVKGET